MRVCWWRKDGRLRICDDAGLEKTVHALVAVLEINSRFHNGKFYEGDARATWKIHGG